MDDDISDRTYASIDPTYGQRSALPDLEDEEDESVKEALAYLRNVRSEASLIPHLLVSQDRLESQQSIDDANGYYEDGAYTGINSSPDDEDDLSDSNPDNQQACYDALSSRFSTARSLLSRNLTLSNPVSNIKSAALDPHSNHAQYNHAFLYTFPITGEIAQTSQEVVMLSLKRYESVLTKRNFMIGPMERSNLGAWGWALLAKCRPSQQMDGDDIAVVREIGKTAIRLTKKIRRESKGIDLDENDLHEEHQVQEAVANDQENSEDQEQSVIFALDILTTIVGKEFGQRDLLDAREAW